ncbi:MAG TPA: orotidine-5'-phosphate decarboxylase [Actinomycetota bacterium]|nr:orotidine-5'-phosphate decarboxylase [Actinomycetota bacterium]
MTRRSLTLDNPICVPLDFAERARVVATAGAVAPHVGMLKIGLTTFISDGRGLVEELSSLRPVFLDLKLHDIPMQVEGAMAAVAATGAAYTTVHSLGGADMVRTAVEASGETLVLAVTILTSIDAPDLERAGITGSPEDAVLRLAAVALEGGAPGLVCSPREVAALRDRFGRRADGGPLLVVPGIRSSDAAPDDQRRTLGARQALEAGADVIVVGRPITAAADPARAAAALSQKLS